MMVKSSKVLEGNNQTLCKCIQFFSIAIRPVLSQSILCSVPDSSSGLVVFAPLTPVTGGTAGLQLYAAVVWPARASNA